MLTLDRIVGNRAILIDEQGDEWEIPSSALPRGSHEGDLLNVRLKKRKGASKNLQKEIHSLQEKLQKLKKEV
jgi:hypothetical protein